MKNKAGITLITLVITIIVLLILLGISVSLIIGDNGVISKATDAVKENKSAMAKEEIELALASCESEYLDKHANDSYVTKNEFFTKENIDKYLGGKASVEDLRHDGNGQFYLTYILQDNNEKYRFVIDNQDKIILRNKSFMLGSFETNYSYNDKPVLVMGDEFEFDNVKINNGKLNIEYFIEGERETASLDIIKYNNFDCVDFKDIYEYDESLPTLIIDSNYEIVKDLSKCNFKDYYYVISLNFDEEYQYLISGNYIVDYGYWIENWFNDKTIKFANFIGYNNLDIAPYSCVIYRKLDDLVDQIYDTKYLQEDFKDAVDLLNTIKIENDTSVSTERENNFIKSITYENSEYIATLNYVIGYDGYPAFSAEWSHGEGIYNFCDMSTILYDIGTKQPSKIRNKSTKQYIKYNDLLEELENSENEEEIYEKYEFKQETKIHILKQGKIIKS